MDAFRTKKETIKATYSAAEAQTRINEAFSGISEEMGDVGLAIQRAEDKTAQMQARAGAIDELMASGALDDAVGTPPRRHPDRARHVVREQRRRERAEQAKGRDHGRGAQAARGRRQRQRPRDPKGPGPSGTPPASIPAADRPAEPQDGEG